MTSQLSPDQNNGERIIVEPDTFTLPERDFWSATEVTEYFGPNAVTRRFGVDMSVKGERCFAIAQLN